MEQLIEMGFANRALNEELLVKHDHDIQKVIQELVNDPDNDWHERRHGDMGEIV